MRKVKAANNVHAFSKFDNEKTSKNLQSNFVENKVNKLKQGLRKPRDRGLEFPCQFVGAGDLISVKFDFSGFWLSRRHWENRGRRRLISKKPLQLELRF